MRGLTRGVVVCGRGISRPGGRSRFRRSSCHACTDGKASGVLSALCAFLRIVPGKMPFFRNPGFRKRIPFPFLKGRARTNSVRPSPESEGASLPPSLRIRKEPPKLRKELGWQNTLVLIQGTVASDWKSSVHLAPIHLLLERLHPTVRVLLRLRKGRLRRSVPQPVPPAAQSSDEPSSAAPGRGFRP